MSTPYPTDKVTIRSVETIQEMRGVEVLQSEVWGPADTVPISHLVATKAAGGLIIAAFDKERVVGFVYGFIGKDKDRFMLHSHMLAVKSQYRGLGLGYRLKLSQREQAQRLGFDTVTWTFDPLQSRNAHINFSKLGVTADRYLVNFYGPEPANLTSLHLETDRLWVTWSIKSSRVAKRVEEPDGLDPGTLRAKLRRGFYLVDIGPDELPRLAKSDEWPSHEYVLIEIPHDISALARNRPDAVRPWREATRQAFVLVLNSGYTVEEFSSRSVSGKLSGIYILSSSRSDLTEWQTHRHPGVD